MYKNQCKYRGFLLFSIDLMRVFISTSLACILCLCVYGQNKTLVINEFMFDPTPAVGLPEAEYVEIMNTTKEPIHLSGWTLNDHPIPDASIWPGAWIVCCEVAAIDQFHQGIHLLGLYNWDRLNNDGQVILLKDPSGSIVDSVAYDDSWITDPDKKGGGWSLEVINPLKTCSGKDNWNVSVNVNGGTPGFNNSIFNMTPDITAPEVMHVGWLDALSLSIYFSETVDFRSELSDNAFSVSPGQVQLEMVYKNYTNFQVLKFEEALDTGRLYQLRIQNIRDCENNLIQDTLLYIGVGDEPLFNDILISELMVDEIPSVGMPESEYIEILNVSDKLLHLDHSLLFAGAGFYEFPKRMLHPGSYYLLIPSSKAELFENYSNTIVMEKFPRLKNVGLMLGIYNNRNGLIFSMSYDKDWYHDESKSNGGYSIEMIDTDNPCGGKNNWRVTQSMTGGTPARINAASDNNPDISRPQILSAYSSEDDKIFIRFNEKIHPGSFKNMLVTIDNVQIPQDWKYDTLSLDNMEIEIPHTANEKYLVNIQGARDCVGNYILKDEGMIDIYVPLLPDSGELVINEILFNPKPGGVDWIEIYNPSEKHISVRNWYITDQQNQIVNDLYLLTTLHWILKPHSFMVITSDMHKLLADFPFARPENILEVPDMPSMPDPGGYISVWRYDTVKMDEMSYLDDMHNALIKDSEGVSLERISPQLPAFEPSNWHSASSLFGYGTPTYRNSHFPDSIPLDFEISVSPPVFSPDQDGFNDFLKIDLKQEKSGYVTNIFIFNIGGQMVKTLGKGVLLGTKNTMEWDGLLDNGQLAKPGYYILFLEIFHPEGKFSTHKRKFVVATRL
jgi:hypothetical protein